MIDMAESPDIFLRTPDVRIMAKKKWSDLWLEQEHLECLRCTDCAGPEMPSATFRYRAGHILREGDDKFRDYPLKDLRGYFIKVEVDIGQAWELLWVGRIEADTVDYLGLDQGPTADQVLLAYGLQHELDRRPINTAWVKPAAEQVAVEINVALTFNDDYVYGFRTVGNRSAVRVPKTGGSEETGGEGSGSGDAGDVTLAYAFSGDRQIDGKRFVWTVRDILEHILRFHQIHSDDRAVFSLGGAADALNTIVYPEIRAEGETIFSLLNRLLDRRRGLGWCVRYDWNNTTQREAPVIHVFTHSDVAITFNDGVLPANPDTIEIETDRSKHLVEVEQLSKDTLSFYGKVVVEGERVLVAFSASVQDGTIRRGWSLADQVLYKAAAGSAAAAEDNDLYRSQDRFADVFQKFLLPENWDFKAGDGEGGDKSTINLKVDPTTGAIDPTAEEPAIANIRTWGQSLSRSLPLPKSTPSATNEPEFLSPFVLVRKVLHGGYFWQLAEYGSAGGVRLLDREFGFALNSQMNHMMAKTDWTGANATELEPLYDWTRMIATVAMRTDERLRVEVTIPGGDPDRVLYVRVPDAELWWIVKGTVTGVDSAGALQKKSESEILRNDADRLKQIAACCKTWYGREHQAATVRFTEILTDSRVGDFVLGIGQVGDRREVNAIISRVEWDLEEFRTTIFASYSELDVSHVGGAVRRHTLH